MNLDVRSAPDDELLQALTVGDVPADDAAVRARFAADPDLHARWRELSSTLGELRALGADFADLSTSGTPLPDDRVAAAAATVRAFRGSAPHRRWWLVAAAAAAAMLAVAWLLWSLRGEPAPPADPNLGGGAAGTATPAGDWEDGLPFRWTAVRNAAGYRVHVQAPDGSLAVLPNGADGELLRTNTWLPSREQRAALPERFQWRVVAFDAGTNSLHTSAWTTVRRR